MPCKLINSFQGSEVAGCSKTSKYLLFDTHYPRRLEGSTALVWEPRVCIL